MIPRGSSSPVVTSSAARSPASGEDGTVYAVVLFEFAQRVTGSLVAAIRRWQLLYSTNDRREIPRVDEAEIVCSQIDAIAVLRAPDEGELGHAVMALMAEEFEFTDSEGWIRRVPPYSINPHFLERRTSSRGARSPGDGAIEAYVLIHVRGTSSGLGPTNVQTSLQKHPLIAHVAFSGIVHNQNKVFARIHARSKSEFDRLILTQIAGIEDVESTETYVIVHSERSRAPRNVAAERALEELA